MAVTINSSTTSGAIITSDNTGITAIQANNVTSLTADGNGNAIIANNITVGTSVMGKNTYFQWNSPMFASANLTGYYGYSGSTVVGSTLGNASFYSVNSGYSLTTASGQSGSVYWNVPGFDYTKDFEVRLPYYIAGSGTTAADGMGIIVGATTAPTATGTGVQQGTQGLGGLAFTNVTYTNQYTKFNNSAGTQIGQQCSWNTSPTNGWCFYTLRVKTQSGKRIASVYFNGILQNAIDITSGNGTGVTFGGGYLTIFAYSGGVGSNNCFNQVELVYI